MARQVPVAAFPFTAMMNETTTGQTPVAGSALVNTTSGATPRPFFRGPFGERLIPLSPTLVTALALGGVLARNPVTTRRRLLGG